ncbi:MAG: hypothetical protein K2X11_16620 [Acetobacteraceae bacterium]|nr:hypothetical protein [Acetobacteraceae bacterium]
MAHARRPLLAALLALPWPAAAQSTALGAALLQFERAIAWEAVSAEWRGIRPRWVQQAGRAEAAPDIAALLLTLETHIGWQAVDRRWANRRPGWVAVTRRATTQAQVARLLLDLEQATLWSAVDPSWRNTRPRWVANLLALAK